MILVVDACTDRTAEVAKRTARERSVRLSLIDGPGQGAGPARRAGMDLAAERLLAHGREDGLVACTDADSRPAPDWLACQLVHIEAGADVVAGLIELDPSESQRLAPEVLRRRRARRDAAPRVRPRDRSRRRPPSFRRRLDRGDRRRVPRRWRDRAGDGARGRGLRPAAGRRTASRSSEPATFGCARPRGPTAVPLVGCRSTSRCRLGPLGAATLPARSRPRCSVVTRARHRWTS